MRNMKLSKTLALTTLSSMSLPFGLINATIAAERPNIVVVFADDMGIGDVAYAGGKAATPHLDAMAAAGMRLENAHTTSSVCTPSRYGLLTGRYSWRTHLQRSVYFKPSDKPLIKDGESTLASMLKENGYQTACVGKWHLGIGWEFQDDYQAKDWQEGMGWDIDYSKPAKTPTSVGFDYFYGIQASLDMAPYVYIENEKAVSTATVVKAFHRPGAASADFEANQCLKVFAKKSVEFIEGAASKEEPFFLYLPLTSPHTPIVPSAEWLGKSELGEYGDFLMETDWVVGQVVDALKKTGNYENTLVIFSTDNGTSPAAKIPDLVAKGHHPNGALRGHKADLFQGGSRVPTLAMWPAVIEAGSETTRLTTLADVYATLADVVGEDVADHEAVDSKSFLPSLKGQQQERGPIILHSIRGDFAIHDGEWKLMFCGDSGGWSLPRSTPEGAPSMQLFNLKKDPAETTNVIDQFPEVKQRLEKKITAYLENGRSTPGAKQENDAEIQLIKVAKPKKKKAKKKP